MSQMQYRQLGAGGPTIPTLMFGAWPIGGGMGAVDEEQAIQTIRHALDLGVTAIDTAEGYRSSETIVGKAVSGRRDEVFLATKVTRGPYNHTRLQEAIANSLRALQTDHVDLYQLHSYPQGVSLEEAMEALVEVKESGKARYVGVSNFTVDQLSAATRLYPVQSLQPRLNIFDSEPVRDLLPNCEREGIGVIVHSPLAKGLLTGKYRPGHVFPPDDERSRFPRFQGDLFAQYTALADELAEIARSRGGISLVQLGIAWTLHQTGVTSCIVGAKSPEQVSEQVSAASLSLSVAELERIDAIAARALAAAG